MKLINSRFYGAMMVITDYVLLGLLWLICSFPLITIYGASVSLIYVIDQWHEGESGNIMRLFFTKFKENIISKTFVSFLFLASFSVIYFDFALLTSQFSQEKAVVVGLIVTGLILLGLFTNMVFLAGKADKIPLLDLFKSAAVSLCVNFLLDLVILLILILNGLLLVLLPVTVFFTPILSAIGIYKLSCKKKIPIHVN